MRYRLFFKSSSKSSIVSLSTPAEPAFALTAFQASYTNSLGMTNGFDALTHLLLLPVGFEVQRLDPCRGRGAACAVPPHGSGLAAFPHPALCRDPDVRWHVRAVAPVTSEFRLLSPGPALPQRVLATGRLC